MPFNSLIKCNYEAFLGEYLRAGGRQSNPSNNSANSACVRCTAPEFALGQTKRLATIAYSISTILAHPTTTALYDHHVGLERQTYDH